MVRVAALKVEIPGSNPGSDFFIFLRMQIFFIFLRMRFFYFLRNFDASVDAKDEITQNLQTL